MRLKSSLPETQAFQLRASATSPWSERATEGCCVGGQAEGRLGEGHARGVAAKRYWCGRWSRRPSSPGALDDVAVHQCRFEARTSAARSAWASILARRPWHRPVRLCRRFGGAGHRNHGWPRAPRRARHGSRALHGAGLLQTALPRAIDLLIGVRFPSSGHRDEACLRA